MHAMRNGFTPENATEISDGELDAISGGLATFGGEIAGHGAMVHVGDVLGGAESLAPSVPGGPLGGLVTVRTVGF
ncbi:hypothetical protein ACFVT2_20030 [Streptomyces sp. NPDC058000]|uniref:hypothetical protein n=1 Tax=Streptomyces sp. NPDC058000 TaxID=3346299 RepID=UPI0036EFA9F7